MRAVQIGRFGGLATSRALLAAAPPTLRTTTCAVSLPMPSEARTRTTVPRVKYSSGGTMPAKAPRNRSVSRWPEGARRPRWVPAPYL